MDREGLSSHHEDANFSLYDAYGTTMDDDTAIADTGYPLSGWDHHNQSAEVGHLDMSVEAGGDYDNLTKSMNDFGSTQFGHEFQQEHSFEHDVHQFQDYMAQETMVDPHSDNQRYGAVNSMDLYHPPSIYPNHSQETPDYVVDRLVQPSVPVPENTDVKPVKPGQAFPPGISTGTTGRQNFKFTPEQKKIMLEKFNAGLHYPTNAEKDSLADMFGASSESISRWFERTRKEKGVQRTRKPIEPKVPDMPQYLPLQPNNPATQQSASTVFPTYGQFPSTYPYNTLDPQFFQQNLQPNISAQSVAINPSAGMYMPIPPTGRTLRPEMLNVTNYSSNGPIVTPQNLSTDQAPIATTSGLANPEDVYTDDIRNAKRPRVEYKPVATTPKETAPKVAAPKKSMTFQEEVLAILRPAEWREDAAQAAQDLYELMEDAEADPSRKLYFLRSVRTNATEIAIKKITSEENRKILAKLRNWLTAAIRANDKSLLSVILEVIKRMNLDPGTMADIKLGKPLALLMDKDEPTLKAQLASLQKTAYEAYALEKSPGLQASKAESPVGNVVPATSASAIPVAAPKAAVPKPLKSSIGDKPASEKSTSASVNKVKVASKLASGSSFFGKLAQTAPIPKAPVLPKPIALKKSTAPSQSMGMTAGGAIKSAGITKPPPKPSIPTPKPTSQSKFSILEYIKSGDSADSGKKDTTSETTKVATRKRKRVSWATEDELEHVKMIENITIKYADDLFWHPPQAFGNARDLDIGEGRAFGKDTVEYDVEEEIEWYEPRLIDFPALGDADERGVKRGGTKVAEGKEAEIQRIREAEVLLITYLNEGDIPESPSEPFLEELVSSQQGLPPKTIPLSQELKQQSNPISVGGTQTGSVTNSDVTAILSSLLAGSGQTTYQPLAPVQNPDLTSILQSLSGQAAPAPVPTQQPAIAPNIDLGALLSQLQPQQAAPPQRWTSPPPSTSTRNKRDERHREQLERERSSKIKRDTSSRIKASRLDDIRESVRSSNADQNICRVLTGARKRIAVG